MLVANALLNDRAFLAANESLINLDNRARATHWREIASAQSLANAMAQKPRRLVRNAKDAMDLMRAHALLAGTHEIDRLQGLMQRNMSRLENRPNTHRKLLPASLLTALAKANAGLTQVVMLGVDRTTMRANRRDWPKHAF